VECHYCKQKGHYKSDCPVLASKRKESAHVTFSTPVSTYCQPTSETALMGFCPALFDGHCPEIVMHARPKHSENVNQNTWLCDSGASSHMKNSSEGMTELENTLEKLLLEMEKRFIPLILENSRP
jgi:hypothetical protein